MALSINPNLTQTGYPSVWTQFSYTVTGLNNPTNSKIAFRYFVTNGGPAGQNSNFIGVDAFTVTSTNLENQEFENNKLTIYPNPANDNLILMSNTQISKAQIYDTTGREIVHYNNISNNNIDINFLSKGAYFIKAEDNNGNMTTAKFIKN